MADSEHDISNLQKSASPSGSALTPEDVQEFQRIVRDEMGVEMAAQEAWDRAIELIALMRMLVRADPEDTRGSRPRAVQSSSRLVDS